MACISDLVEFIGCHGLLVVRMAAGYFAGVFSGFHSLLMVQTAIDF